MDALKNKAKYKIKTKKRLPKIHWTPKLIQKHTLPVHQHQFGFSNIFLLCGGTGDGGEISVSKKLHTQYVTSIIH